MPKRIQRKRTKGWRMPGNTCYVGRPTRWGNPFPIGTKLSDVPASYVSRCGYADWTEDVPITAEMSVEFYEVWIKAACRPERIQKELGGKNLACWCPLDRPCHADILLKLANPEEDLASVSIRRLPEIKFEIDESGEIIASSSAFPVYGIRCKKAPSTVSARG